MLNVKQGSCEYQQVNVIVKLFQNILEATSQVVLRNCGIDIRESLLLPFETILFYIFVVNRCKRFINKPSTRSENQSKILSAAWKG